MPASLTSLMRVRTLSWTLAPRAWLLFAAASFLLTCTVYVPSPLASSMAQVLLVALLSSLTTGAVLFLLTPLLRSKASPGVSFFAAVLVYALVGASRAIAPIVMFSLPWDLRAPLPSAPSSLFFGALFGALFLAAIAGVASTLDGQALSQDELSVRFARLTAGLDASRRQVDAERSFLTRVVDSRITPVLDRLVALVPDDAPDSARLRRAAAAQLPALTVLLASPPPPDALTAPASPSPFAALIAQLRQGQLLVGWVIAVALVMLAPMYLTVDGPAAMAVFCTVCVVLCLVALAVHRLLRPRTQPLIATAVAYAVAVPSALLVAWASTPSFLSPHMLDVSALLAGPLVAMIWLSASLVAGLVASSREHTRWLESACAARCVDLESLAWDSVRVSRALSLVLSGTVQSHLAAASLALGAHARASAGHRSALAPDVSFLTGAAEQVEAAHLLLDEALSALAQPPATCDSAADLPAALDAVASSFASVLDVPLAVSPQVCQSPAVPGLLLLSAADLLAGAARRATAHRAGLDLQLASSGALVLSCMDDGAPAPRLSVPSLALLADAGVRVDAEHTGVTSLAFPVPAAARS